MNYQDQLYTMIASTVPSEEAALALTKAICKLNDERLKRLKYRIVDQSERGETPSAFGALVKAQVELGDKEEE